MPLSGLVAEVRAVDWRSLKSTYGSGEVVRDIILGLSSSGEAEVRQAWQEIGETHLQHQGTVYPATAAAIPFLCRIALDEATRWRAALILGLAYMSTGYDKPYAPAGTARDVRDGVRPYLEELFGRWGTVDQDLDMALVTLSVAFPVDAATIVPQLRDWFGRSEQPVRKALGLALAVHSSADHAVRQIVEDELRQSISWVVRGVGYISWGGRRSESLAAGEEPYIDSPILDAIHVARSLQRGADEQATHFTPVMRLLGTLMHANPLIDRPT